LKSRWIKIVVSSVFYIKANSLFDFRRPIIYKVFSLVPFHIINWMKQLVNKADLILPNSIEESLQLKQIFWVNNNNNIKVLYNWVDNNYFNWISQNLFKEKFWLNNYIMSVSHIEPRKNHLFLIKWFLEYKKLFKSDLKLVLLWDFRWNYFKYHNEIKLLLKNNKTEIIHINNLKNSDNLFKSAYLWAKAHFLLSSLETPGLSNIEAWLWWNKLILWKCKPVIEYFWNYASYINWKNINEIIKQIKNIDKKNWKTNWKTNNQIDFIKKNYTWEVIWTNLLSHYKNICKKK